jgi:hypothetical protein
MTSNLKICLCLIFITLFCCWPTSRIIPAGASSASPISQQNHVANVGLTFNNYLNTDNSGYFLAQLPGKPTFRSKQPKKAAPEELPPPTKPKIPVSSPTPQRPIKTSGRIINVRDFGSSQADLAKAIAAYRKEGGTLYFSTGSWNITADLVIPSSVAIKFARGALLSVATTKASGTISYANEPCPGTISVSDGSTQVSGKGTRFGKLKPGQFITCAGQRREVRTIINNTHLEVLVPFSKSLSGQSFSKSSYTIKGSGTKFDTELRVGDFIYHGGEKHIIASIKKPDILTVLEPPTHAFSQEPFTRSVRLRINGPLEAGLYQIFAGKGVVTFGTGSVTSVHPEWWGAWASYNTLNNTKMATANSDAIEKALRCRTVKFASGVYKINRPIVLQSANCLIGQGMGLGGTTIALVHGANCHMVEDSPGIYYRPGGVKDINFLNGHQDAGYDGIHFINNTKLWQIEHCSFISYNKHPGGYAIYLNAAAISWIKDNFIMGFYNGIFAYGFDSYFINNEIDPKGDYAIYMIGDGNVVQGNIMNGDSGCHTGIFTKTSSATSIIGNRIGPFDNGIKIFNFGGIINGNVLVSNRKNGIYSDHNVTDAIITNNKFLHNKGYGVLITGTCHGSLITNNNFRNNNGGGSNPQIKIEPAGTFKPASSRPLVEDNVGVDLQCKYPILASNRTPAIREAKRWKTANTKAIIITNFVGGCPGKEIIVIFGDAQTTLKFSGPSKLKGHGGTDWRPVPGGHLRAVKGDDGFWYCETFSSSH